MKANWSKLFTFLGKGTGIAAMALVTLAAVDGVIAQFGVQAIPAALLSLLSGLFGDVVAGPLVEKLMSGVESDDKYAGFLDEFAILLADHSTQKEIAQLVERQDTLFAVLGTALQHHENSTVERILNGIACYDHFRSDRILELLQGSLSQLDPVCQHLIGLIHRLEGQAGPVEYVELNVSLLEANTPTSDLDLRKLYPQAYSAMLPQSKEYVLLPIDRRPKQHLGNIRDAVTKVKRFALLGDAGSGKTTTIRRLALESAWARLADSNRPIPLYIDLSDADFQLPLERIVASRWHVKVMDIEVGLVQDKIWLFIDGLDRIGIDRVRISQELKRWLGGINRPKTVVVTSRLKSYLGQFDLGLPIILIDELTNEQISEFAGNYLSGQASEFLELLALPRQGFKTRLSERRSLEKLARNAFLLTGLIIIYQLRANSDLPRNNGALADQLVKALLEREKDPRLVPDSDKLKRSLGRFAFRLTEEQLVSPVPKSIAIELLGGEQYLLNACSATLLQEKDERVEFYHEIIKDYFAASYILEMLDYRDLLGNPQFDDFFRFPGIWDDALIAYSGIVSDSDTFVSELSSIDPLLAAECVGSGIPISEVTKRTFVDLLLSRLSSPNWVIRGDSCLALAKVPTEYAIPKLIEMLYDPLWIYPSELITGSDLVERVDGSLLETGHGFLSINPASYALANIGLPALPHLLKVFRRSTPLAVDEHKAAIILINTAQALVWIGEGAIPTLREASVSRYYASKLYAADALEVIGTSSAIDAAINVRINQLRDVFPYVRQQAALALGRMRASRAVSELSRKLDDTAVYAGKRVCDYVAEALLQIDTEEAKTAIVQWKRYS